LAYESSHLPGFRTSCDERVDGMHGFVYFVEKGRVEFMSILKQKDRVRENSPDSMNERIDREIQDNIELYKNASPEQITRRMEALDREWDIERAIEVNASALGLVGLALAATVNKRWAILSGVVLSFLFQHGVQGWCPPVPLFRSFGVRTRKEIDRERCALKMNAKIPAM